jgi:hypothetical protein
MATHTVQRELLEAEKQYWKAIQDKNVDAAQRLTDDSCIVVGAQGVGRISKQSLAGMMNAAKYTLQDFKISDDVQVTMLSDDVAIVGYKVHEDLTVEGKPVSLDAADASVWVRREGRWRCALHTESIAGDPFGRDRRPSN